MMIALYSEIILQLSEIVNAHREYRNGHSH